VNEKILKIFENFFVMGEIIPVAFIQYVGSKESYVTFTETHKEAVLIGDDDLQEYIAYYDFDIFSKGNFQPIVERVIEELENHAFKRLISNDSPDLFETDTKFYHKTLGFCIGINVNKKGEI